MRTIGLLGGMSWESTALYYRLINEETRRRRGGLHSAPIAMLSVDFQPIEALQHAGNWDALGDELAAAACRVEAAGAGLLVLCTNTMHRVAPAIEVAIDIPFLHIADATARAVQAAGYDRVGLLGTRFTMEQEFYTGRLAEHGIEVLVPGEAERECVHRVIYDELCRGDIRAASRDAYLGIIEGLAARGAGAVIEGCTEIGMLVRQDDTDVPLFDTTAIHAAVAVSEALR